MGDCYQYNFNFCSLKSFCHQIHILINLGGWGQSHPFCSVNEMYGYQFFNNHIYISPHLRLEQIKLDLFLKQLTLYCSIYILTQEISVRRAQCTSPSLNLSQYRSQKFEISGILWFCYGRRLRRRRTPINACIKLKSKVIFDHPK